jgi:hypothetical protein
MGSGPIALITDHSQPLLSVIRYSRSFTWEPCVALTLE